jgi:nitrate reductase NapAB chaperone NapD
MSIFWGCRRFAWVGVRVEGDEQGMQLCCFVVAAHEKREVFLRGVIERFCGCEVVERSFRGEWILVVSSPDEFDPKLE